MTVRYTKPLDGGWGWAVVLAVFVICACTMGVTRSFGVFFIEFASQFDQPATATSWVISVAMAITFGGAFFGGMFGTMFGFRPVAMVGGVLAATGCILTSFAGSIVHLYLTTGVLTGFGSSLAFIPSMSMVGKYFDKKRAIANGIAFSGVSVGNIVFPLIFTYLIEEYGWRGSFLIAAGVMLNITAFAALLRPIQLAVPSLGTDAQAPANAPPTLRNGSSGAEQRGLPRDDSEMGSPAGAGPTDDMKVAIVSNGKSATPTPRSPGKMILAQWKSLLAYIPFVCLTISVFLLGFGFFIPIVHMAPRARYLGIEQYQAAFLISMISIGDVVGRIASGFLPTSRRLRLLHWYILSMLGMGTTSLLSPLANTYATLATYSIFYGILGGASMSISLTVLAELVGPARLSNAMGLMTLLMSVAILGGPPVAGALYDATKSYNMSFIVAGCAPVLGGLIAAILMCLGDENVRRVSGRESYSAVTDPANGDHPSVVKSNDKEILKPFVIETSV
ncbi:monocarboxylate transporter 13-like [Branchiostoma floridae]|uniref:Monocarboxylate transporter 13-like n=1 Tax=Branchiostoma floridae TaxID=7739 RepID=A0A9J7MYD2_BRAFL|nr:monocarboxylate transporter 13-like [Branchiostoma floridae]XP_035683178.1 monocarboxylate transporter 13-like [Branchiostoma floridae]XP_035683179.1 monocarboxylate transporter 13-like [Branchiostoma floridae]